jgi:hypothetical protein
MFPKKPALTNTGIAAIVADAWLTSGSLALSTAYCQSKR